MHYAISVVTFEGVLFQGQNGSQNFCFYKCYDICFHNFCDKHPLMGKKRF